MSIRLEVIEAVRDGRVTMHRYITGAAAGPYADFYTYAYRVSGTKIAPSWQAVFRQILKEGDVFVLPVLPPSFAAAHGLVTLL